MTDIIIDENALKHAGAKIIARFNPVNAAIVADDNTYPIAGNALQQQLSGRCELVQLGKPPQPDDRTGERLIQATLACDLIIAVGSGSINDLCKYAAARRAVPYVSVATAPSMNGYVSPTASLSVEGHKTSLPALPPQLLIADLTILAAAPRRLIHAGLGDALSRSSVQTDWLLAHYLLDVPYNPLYFTKLIEIESELLKVAPKLVEKDIGAVRLLMEMLIEGGAVMAKAKSSMPASQGEHMIAHTMEMLYGHNTHGPYHGEQIAVTTLAMSKLQEKLMLRAPEIKPNPKELPRFVQLFGSDLAEPLYEMYQKKQIDSEHAAATNARMAEVWPALCEAINAVRISVSMLERTFRQAHCPVSYKDIGWQKDRYEHAVTHAHLTRDRFTFLDLAAMDKRLRYWF